ncbi:hypothetical protein IFM89_019015 [Coptis chinensis]|uniref:Protein DETOXIFICATION n=1 Tax=Coptis chinensis TaxID=261450 RepID=A0A835LJ40_9MAGN|nr:hypothetical protein IFM89_019015 [Coptis chinensis]
MATSFFHPVIFTYSRKQTTNIPPVKLNTSLTRLRRTIPKSSLQNNPNNLKKPGPKPNKNSFFRFLPHVRNVFKFDELGIEILSIAFPAALALAADPIASLVDSAFVGHLGSVELAAVGVSMSVFNLVSNLFNVPLLNITTSFVAEEQALAYAEINSTIGINTRCDYASAKPMNSKKLFPAVSTSLALAAGIGIAEAIALSFGSGFLMNILCISVDSPMRLPAEQFLALRAFGAPAIVIALAAQGTFRGFMDTKTPLYATVTGNLLNAILDPVLIFAFGLGIGGAAISTVISEYVKNVVKVFDCRDPPSAVEFKSTTCLSKYKWEENWPIFDICPEVDHCHHEFSCGLLVGRTIAVLFTMTLATSMAARQGPIPMAGHQICLQVWLAVSLLTDALALAGQALLASGYSQRDYIRAQDVIYKVLQIGLLTGVALAVMLFFGFETFSRLFTSDSAVLEITRSGVLFVAGSQPVNALAFVLDGLYYGVSDFPYAAYSMVLVGLITSMFLYFAAPVYGLAGVWMGLFLFMSLRVVAGLWR